MEALGAHERHIARSTLVQQAAQIYAVFAMLVVVTLLARSLSLGEFGLYGLLISVSTYVLFLQGSVSNATVRAIASAPDRLGRDRVYAAAVVTYAGAGLLAGLGIACFGMILAAALDLTPALRDQARAASLAMGAATALGWPAKVFDDSLRGRQRFFASAIVQLLAYSALVAGMLALVAVEAPVWTEIALGASLPILIGVGAVPIALLSGEAPRVRRGRLGGDATRDLVRVSRYLWSIGLADVVTSSLDRVILAGFRSTATVGLYEGAARPHTLVRQLHATLAQTVVPVASGYIAAHDDLRLQELLVRGTRYVMAVVVPVTVVLMTLSDRILDVWLGETFVAAAPAMTILLSYWLVQSGTGVAGGMLVAAGRLHELNRYAWLVAGTNLAMSLVLTALFGLEGVVIGTALPYLLFLPYLVRITLRTFRVPLDRLIRAACVPAYATGALVAAVATAFRLVTPLDSVGSVMLAAAAALAAGWGCYAVAWMQPSERRLARSLLRSSA